MSKKVKIMMILLLILIAIGVILFFSLKNSGEQEIIEYTPQQEISDEQLRQTFVSLYFKNKETGEIMPEGRVMDAKMLLNNPYEQLLNMLIEGPKNTQLENSIPMGTKLNKVELKSGTVWIDFSKEFIQNHPGGKEEEQKTISCLVNTLTELTEVNSIRIVIEGKEDQGFADNGINFKENFIRQK